MFVDACVIVSIVTGEDTAPAYDAALSETETAFTSALAAWEAVIILARPDHLDCSFSAAEGAVLTWLDERQIALREPSSSREVLSYAVAVAEKHGLGRRYLSNFDCFHYAYAKAMDVPLLTLDQLLRETDIETLPS